MSTAANMLPDPAPILACTISRDIQNFDLLIDDMELEMGESWGDLTFEDAREFLTQPTRKALNSLQLPSTAKMRATSPASPR
jgi:pilus assembly protein CpaE